jgi:hypothetical protein
VAVRLHWPTSLSAFMCGLGEDAKHLANYIAAASRRWHRFTQLSIPAFGERCYFRNWRIASFVAASQFARNWVEQRCR